MKVFSGLYNYEVWAVLFDDGTRWVRMGCLWKSLSDWKKTPIRTSNLSEFPNDKSYASEERARAFAFARMEALKLK